MKPVLEAVQALQTQLASTQSGILDRTDQLSRAIEAMVKAETEKLNRDEAAMRDRHERDLADLHEASSLRQQSFHLLREAVMRMRGEVQDGSDDGAAMIAAAFAPARIRNVPGAIEGTVQ